MKKLALFCVLLSLMGCSSSQPQKPPDKSYKEKVREKKDDAIREIQKMHAAEDIPR